MSLDALRGQLSIPGSGIPDVELERAEQSPSAKVNSNERYTPIHILEIATRACGPIHYDPCTSASNHTRALSFSCLPENGLLQDWVARAKGGLVWENSPFSHGQLLKFASKTVIEARRGAEIVMLTPVDPSTKWFEVLSSEARVAAGLKKRVKFLTPAGQVEFKSGADAPTMLWYFGPNIRAFVQSARPHAHLYQPGII